MYDRIHIWDYDKKPEDLCSSIVLWRIYDDKITSIPNLIEANSDSLKLRYLKWVYDIGVSKINGKELIDRLEIRDKFSFWWMNRISEKCNYSASPQLTDAIRLMAFDDWLIDKKVKTIEFSSTNLALSECLKIWCEKKGIEFSENMNPIARPKLSFFTNLYKLMPHILRALAQLGLYAFTRWPLKGAGLDEWKATNGKVSFFSYLFNLNDVSANNGKFDSGFWSILPEELQKTDIKTNWLHIFCEDSLHPKPRDAVRIIKQFNKSKNNLQTHVCLDSFLSVKVCFRTIFDWMKVRKSSKSIEQKLKNVKSNGLYLWPLYEQEWKDSVIGVNSILNLLTLNLFENALESLPSQDLGIYLYEQQSWELALIYAWKLNQNGKIIGAQHSTMLYWDMRYFHDPRTYERKNEKALPMPDLVAVNGPKILKNSILSGYPKHRLIEVEALRYLYLQNYNNIFNPVKKNEEKRPLTILIVTDYLHYNTDFQLKLLSNSIKLLRQDIKFILKPHPNLKVKISNYQKIKMSITDKAISTILPECDVVYASSVTSAAVDAYCAGKWVITALNSNTLNLSPLRGYDDVFFVSTPNQFSTSLQKIYESKPRVNIDQEFFNIDNDLPKWKKLIAQSLDKSEGI